MYNVIFFIDFLAKKLLNGSVPARFIILELASWSGDVSGLSCHAYFSVLTMTYNY